MNELEQILEDALDKWGQETVQAILRKIDSYPIRWKGLLRRSISYDIKGQNVEFLMADYGKFIDEGIGLFGSRKTRIPTSKKGALAYYLKEWSTSKGLNSWAVATNIIKRGGIKPRPFFNSVIQQRVQGLDKVLNDAYDDFLQKAVDNASK